MTTRFIDQAVHVDPVLFCAGRDNLENKKIKHHFAVTGLKNDAESANRLDGDRKIGNDDAHPIYHDDILCDSRIYHSRNLGWERYFLPNEWARFRIGCLELQYTGAAEVPDLDRFTQAPAGEEPRAEKDILIPAGGRK